jgi:hypothetical protein
MIEIQLDNENHFNVQMKYVGDKNRLASATDVKFIDDNTLLCASFSGCYLLIYDLNKSTCIEKIYTYVKNKKSMIDLIHLYNGKIYVTHFLNKCIGIYLLQNNKIIFDSVISTELYGTPHGIFFNDDMVIYTTVNTSSIILNNQKIYQHVNKSQIQSVSFYNNKIIACGTYARVESFSNKNKMKSFIIELIKNNDGTYLSKCFEYNNCRFDGMCIYENKLFVCDQYNDRIMIFEIHTVAESLCFDLINTVNDVSFCHGCDFYNNKLAVACYGTCSIKIFDM